MEKQLVEPEVYDELDSRRLSTADLVVATERTTTTVDRPADDRPAVDGERGATPLFESGEAQRFRSQWEKIQIGFVDEPRSSVEQADELVATVIKRLAEVFAEERNKLERDWDKEEGKSTEDLRVALRRYRSFFDRLLAV